MKLIKRIIELVLVMMVITLFMMNKDVVMSINLFGLTQEPLQVSFWVLVTICVSLGIFIAAVGDFVTQLQWHKERKRMIKTDKEHETVVKDLEAKIETLSVENERLAKELESERTKSSDEPSSFQTTSLGEYTSSIREKSDDDEDELNDDKQEEEKDSKI